MPQSILTNTVIASGGRVVNVGLGVVAIALLTRILGPAQYGSYALIMAVGITFQLVADLGLYLTLTRDIAESPDKVKHYISTTTSLRLVLLVGALLVGGLLTVFIPQLHGLSLPFYIIAIGLAAQSLSQLLMGVYQHYQEVWRATIADLLGRSVQIGLIVATASTASLLWMALAFTLGAILAHLINVWLLPRQATWRPVVNTQAWKRLVSVSWPLGALLLLNAVYFRSDAFILALFWDRTEVGLYGLAYRIVESSLFFPAMLGGLLLPRLTENLRKNRQRATQLLTEGLHIVTIAAVFIVIAFLMRSESIVILLSGEQFTAAGPLLAVLSIALAGMFLGNIFGFTLIALKLQRQLLAFYAVLVVANVIANLLFIPRFGAHAAALTTVVTEAAAVLWAGWLVRRHLPYRLVRGLPVFIVASALAVGVFWFMSQSPVLIQLVAAGVVYCVVVWVGGLISKQYIGTLR